MKSAATDTSVEIRNSALWTVLRAITVNNPAKMAAIAKIQKKTASQPERTIVPTSEFQRLGFVLTRNPKLRTRNDSQLVYLTVSLPCSSISRFQTKPARE